MSYPRIDSGRSKTGKPAVRIAVYSALLLLVLSTLLACAKADEQPPAAQTDPILEYLKRPRFYVIIAVNQINLKPANTALPYALVDAADVKASLEHAGFRPLSESPPLTGADASYPKIDALLRDIRNLPDNSTVLVYYSGHAFTNAKTKELWLQLYDNTVLGDQGLSIGTLLNLARGEGWNGELALVVDSCYSGKIAFAYELSGDTVVLASSDQSEPSRPLLPAGATSAFTHALILGGSTNFSEANAAQDGVLTFGQLSDFASSELIDWQRQGKIDGAMHPRIFENTSTIIFEYDPAHVVNLNSPIRKIIANKILLAALPAPSATLSDNLSSSPTNLEDLRKVSTGLLSSIPDGPEKDALTKLSQGSTADALVGLEQVRDAASSNSPTRRQADSLLARLYAATGKDTDAAAAYSDLLSNTPDPSNELKVIVASSLTRARSFDKAEALLTDVIRSSDKNQSAKSWAIAQNNLGVLYVEQGKYRPAQNVYSAALKEASQYSWNAKTAATINSNLANAYRLDAKLPQAEKQYAQAVERDPKSPPEVTQKITDLERYSTVLGASKKPEKAEATKRQAESLKAEHFEASVSSQKVPNL
jgi:tetratricopeptide (TPR) repeat protein